MIDTSPSTAHKLDAVKSLAKLVLTDLGTEPQVAIVEFSGSVRLVSDVTKDRDAALRAIDKAAMGDGTALYGSMDVLFQKIAPKLTGRKIAILLSDGVDTVSKSTYASSLLEAEKSDIAVYSIYMDTFSSASSVTRSLPRGITLPPGILSGRITEMNKKEYDKGLLYLNDLADLSGGRVVRSEKLGSLPASFKDEFSLQYYISFSFQDSSVDRRSSVRIRVNKPGLTVQTRRVIW